MESNGSRDGLQFFFYEDGAQENTSYKVNHIFVKEGVHILKKRRICELSPTSVKEETLVIKSKFTGIIKKIFVKKNAEILSGAPLIEVDECTHPTMLGNICCDCGSVLEVEKPLDSEEASHALVSMLHSIPDLKVSRQEAERLGMEDINNLLENKKLVLLVDLDQTLVHTTNDNIPPKLKDVYHFQLMRSGPWYHTRIRPYTKKFLQTISQFYELHICTFGVREYAHHIAHFLDNNQKLFGHRILSRNECLDPMSKKANLSSLFPCGDNLVCIIDDRSDVWNFAPNVVQVLPYHFFQHTGDINAPVELQKRENDDTRGFDFTKIESTLKQSTKDEEEKEMSSTRESEDEDVKVSATAKAPKDSASDESTTANDSPSEVVKPSSEPCTKCKDLKTSSESGSESCQKCECDSDQTNLCDRNPSSDEEADSNPPKNSSETRTANKKPPPEPSGNDSLNVSAVDSICDDEVKLNEESGLIEVPDTDDYLLYLEDILINLHRKFYENYAKREEFSESAPCQSLDSLPDLKKIVPLVRREVLSGVNLVFSGIIPHHVNLESSKPYHIAISLGATVSKKVVPKSPLNGGKSLFTTHIVAANLHTEKVRQARKFKHIKIVSPNWLWCCAERWERVDERLFQLSRNSEESISRNPPMHCCIHPFSRSESSNASDEQQQFVEDLNPLAFMTNDEAKSMEEEVDIVLSDDDEADEKNSSSQYPENKEMTESSSSSSEETPKDSSSEEDDEGAPKHKRKRPRGNLGDDAGDTDDELPSVRFRQGGALPSDESTVESDDEDLNAYGDILARELLE